jgi:hypothetical protein
MTNAEKFQHCLAMAKRIVSAHRAEAPAGCDPVNTWVAIGVGVAGIAVSAGTSAYQSNQQKKAAEKAASGATGNKLSPVDFPNMPNYIPADFNKLNQAATTQDRIAYRTSDADFRSRHGGVVSAEKAFEESVANDQKGNKTLMPQLQNEYMTAGLGNALSAFGDAGPVLTQGSGAQANVAKNLGLDIVGFQQQQRQNAQQSLSLAEQIFPRRQIGLSGQDASQVALGNLAAQNAWSQADYANRVDQLEFNQKIAAGNSASQIQSNNALAAAQGQLGAAQAQMYGSIAQSAIGVAGNAYGQYQARQPAAGTWGGNYATAGTPGGATYNGAAIPVATANV